MTTTKTDINKFFSDPENILKIEENKKISEKESLCIQNCQNELVKELHQNLNDDIKNIEFYI